MNTKLCIADQRQLIPEREFLWDGLSVQSLHRLAGHERSWLNLALDWMLEVNACTQPDMRRLMMEGNVKGRWHTQHVIAAFRTCAGGFLPPWWRVSRELDDAVVRVMGKCVLRQIKFRSPSVCRCRFVQSKRPNVTRIWTRNKSTPPGSQWMQAFPSLDDQSPQSSSYSGMAPSCKRAISGNGTGGPLHATVSVMGCQGPVVAVMQARYKGCKLVLQSL